MFHYSLVPSSNRSRMLIAVFLAVAVHMGLMNFEFTTEPIHVPDVSLPRSVSVFLGQKKMGEIPVQQIEKKQIPVDVSEEQPVAEMKHDVPAPQIKPAIKEVIESPIQKPALLQETGKQHSVKSTMPASQKSDDIVEDILKNDKAGRTQDPVLQAEHQTGPEGEGVSLPGTLQLAYPRYQLNTPPPYPHLSRKRGQEGTVILQVLVNDEGRADDLKIEKSSGFGLLDRAAEKAVATWIFEPGRHGQERVPMWVRVPVTFKLNK